MRDQVPNRYTARVVRPHELTDAERGLWISLCRDDELLRHPFLSLGFTQAVGEVFANSFVAVIERSGEVAGFFPFQFGNGAHHLLRAAERIGGDLSDACGLIARSNVRISTTELLSLAGLSTFTFNYLFGTQLRYGLDDGRSSIGLRIPLGSSDLPFWAQLKSTNGDFARQVERKERQLVKRLGPVRFQFDSPDHDEELERVIRIKREQYRRTGDSDPLAQEWRRKLLRNLLGSTDKSCSGVLSTLYAGDTWLAAHLGLRSETILHQWFPVYSSEFQQFSPGHVLTRYMVTHADSIGMKEFNFGGFGDYKIHFRPEQYDIRAGVWRDGKMRSLVYHMGQAIGWRVAKRRAAL